jgi:hypothetical protein
VLRAGNNDLRFTLPLSVYSKLRRSAGRRASSNVLSLTTVSPSGADGSTVTRALRLARTRHR